MKIKCIIVDDDIHSITGLKSYIQLLPQLELTSTYTDSLQALTEISNSAQIDIIFMDVDMPMITGIELSKAIKHKGHKLVFTTSYPKYAYDAFELHANDFLLKPYTFARFAETINRLFPKQQMKKIVEKQPSEEYFFVRNKNENNNLIRICYIEIIAIESLQNYVRIYTLKEAIVTYISLSEMREILKDQPDFLQVHRSFIISKNFISKVDGNTILMHDGMEITIGKFFKEQVQEYIRQNTIRTNRL